MSAARNDVFRRRTGVLLHPTSLPGASGVGGLGREARHFVDWLVQAGVSVWQVLPLVPPGAGENGVPRQLLFGFERVRVPAGGSAAVHMAVEARHLTRVEGGARVPLRGTWRVVFGVEHEGRAATARVEHEVEL